MLLEGWSWLIGAAHRWRDRARERAEFRGRSRGGGTPKSRCRAKGETKRALTPEEQERQKQLDDDYKAAQGARSKRQRTRGPTCDRRRPFPPKKGAEISSEAQRIATNIAKLPELLGH